MFDLRTTSSALLAVLLLAGTVAALDVKIETSCESDTLTVEDGKEGRVHGGEEANITFKSLTRKEVTYEFRSGGSGKGTVLNSPWDKVISICFGEKNHTYDQAQEAFDAGDFASAAPLFEQAAKEKGASAVWAVQFGYYYCGLSHLRAGNLAAADKSFEALQRAAPDNMFAGAVQVDQVKIKAGLGDIAGALSLIGEIFRDPALPGRDKFELEVLKGQLYVKQKDWAGAEAAFRDAIGTARTLGGSDSAALSMRCTIALAEVSLGKGDVEAARAAADSVLAQTRFAEENEHEARAYALVLLGDCFVADANKASGDPQGVRTLLEKGLECFLKAVAIYGDDRKVAAEIRGLAFSKAIELAGPQRLNDRAAAASIAQKADVAGFKSSGN